MKGVFFSSIEAAQKGVKTVATKGGYILDLGSFSMKLTRSNNLGHLDVAITKQNKRPESACCAISGRTLCYENVLMASVSHKSIELSAVSMNIDQRALENGSVGYNNDSSTYTIHYPTSTKKSSDVSCCGKDDPPLSMVEGIDKGIRVQMILKMNTMAYKTWKLRTRIPLETIVLLTENVFCGTPKRASTVQTRVRSTESYAFVRSIKHTYNGIWFFRANSCSRRITNIISMVERFGRKQLCSYGRIPTRLQYSLRRRAMTFSSILPACATSEMPL